MESAEYVAGDAAPLLMLDAKFDGESRHAYIMWEQNLLPFGAVCFVNPPDDLPTPTVYVHGEPMECPGFVTDPVIAALTQEYVNALDDWEGTQSTLGPLEVPTRESLA